MSDQEKLFLLLLLRDLFSDDLDRLIEEGNQAYIDERAKLVTEGVPEEELNRLEQEIEESFGRPVTPEEREAFQDLWAALLDPT